MRNLWLLIVPSVALALDSPASPYAPLEYLAGSCWQGELAGGKDVDTYCFSWVYGGKDSWAPGFSAHMRRVKAASAG